MKGNFKGGRCTHEGISHISPSYHLFVRCDMTATHRVAVWDEEKGNHVRSKWLCEVHAITTSRNEVTKDMKRWAERNERGDDDGA